MIDEGAGRGVAGIERIWTIGHSTRTLEELFAALDAHGIQALADIRHFPGSRRYPYFHRDELAKSVPAHGIAYLWIPRLGGRRRVVKDSPNTAWRNASFQGYADYMATDEFAAGLEELLAFAAGRRTAMMCAEAVWWRCHRSMVSDLLQSRGVDVVHIIDARHVSPHPYTEPARLVDGRLSYIAGAGVPLRTAPLGSGRKRRGGSAPERSADG